MARKCYEEIKNGEEKEKRLTRWEEEKEEFFKKMGADGEEIKRLKEREANKDSASWREGIENRKLIR